MSDWLLVEYPLNWIVLMTEFVAENLKFALKLINVQIRPLQYISTLIMQQNAHVY